MLPKGLTTWQKAVRILWVLTALAFGTGVVWSALVLVEAC